MRGARSGRSVMLGAVAVALVSGACATSPSAYLNRDEPANRTTGAGREPRGVTIGGGTEYRGTVVRVDQPQQVVVLDNGQMYRVTDDRAILVNGQPVLLDRVRPGMPVTIVSGTPVAIQNGQYVALPPGATVVTVPGQVLRTYARVADVNRDGTVKLKLSDGQSLMVQPPAGTVLRRDDVVAIDMTVGTVAPSALPR
jgi:hypothetical protein